LDVLTKLENVPGDDSNRPLDDIIMENVVVFVDPFEEFQKQKLEKDEAEKQKEEIKKQGGTEDDKTTWTGKRLRADGTFARSEQSTGVGKYLKSAAMDASKNDGKYTEDDEMLEPEPAKKKVKAGGFGNFDGW